MKKFSFLNICNIINPENDTEFNICKDPSFIEGCNYGKPRKGHPEGEVINHIKEVLENVNKYCDEYDRYSLRIIAIVHDSFKYKVDRSKQKTGENHHAMKARRFAEKYLDNKQILDIIELHDEAYLSAQKGYRDGQWEKANERAAKLISRLGKDNIDLYIKFYHCDNETGNKTQDQLIWFKRFVDKKYNFWDYGIEEYYQGK